MQRNKNAGGGTHICLKRRPNKASESDRCLQETKQEQKEDVVHQEAGRSCAK